MSDLVVIAFPTEAKAEEVRQKLLAMQKEYLIELSDAVIAVKDSKGQIKLNQTVNTTAVGAVTGAFWGSLIGLIFLMPLAGAALGAASGTLSGYLTDIGINDKWMKERKLPPFNPEPRHSSCWCAKSRQTRFLTGSKAKAARCSKLHLTILRKPPCRRLWRRSRRRYRLRLLICRAPETIATHADNRPRSLRDLDYVRNLWSYSALL